MYDVVDVFAVFMLNPRTNGRTDERTNGRTNKPAVSRAKVMEGAAGKSAGLEFDKDNSLAMAFVTAASNLRSRVFQVSNEA